MTGSDYAPPYSHNIYAPMCNTSQGPLQRCAELSLPIPWFGIENNVRDPGIRDPGITIPTLYRGESTAPCRQFKSREVTQRQKTM